MNSSDQNSHRNLARPTTVQTCGNCGLPRHPAGKPCPGKGKTCAFCGKLNHYASVCRQKSKSANEVRRSFVNPIPEEPRINRITPGHPTIQLLSTCDEHTVVCRNPTITVRILNSRKPGRNTAATADTSACATILGTDLYQDMGMKLNELSDRGADTLSAVDGFRLQSIGRMVLDLEHRATPSGRRQLSVWGVVTTTNLLRSVELKRRSLHDPANNRHGDCTAQVTRHPRCPVAPTVSRTPGRRRRRSRRGHP